MLDSAKARERFLVCTAVEESHILLTIGLHLRQENSVTMNLSIVEILAVASQSAKMHTLIRRIPVVDRQERITLVDSPSVRQRCYER